jgi:hypothetical protein
MRQLIRVSLLTFVPILALSSCDTTSRPAAAQSLVVHGERLLPGPIDRRTPSGDLRGNDVLSAVATYESTSDGTFYEVHSPETALEQLKSPVG